MKPNYTRVMRALTTHPWAIMEPALDTICGIVEARANGAPSFTTDEIRAQMGAVKAAAGATLQGNGTIAVIPLVGVLAPKMNMMVNMSGGTSLDQFRQQLARAVADSTVKAIIIAVDSPGGSVAGCQETWSAIMAARGSKPIVASVEYLMGSAALWLASACDSIEMAPSGEGGSLGVFAVHEDDSQAEAMAGVKITYVRSAISPYKAEANPDEPLSDAARTNLQARVDAMANLFLEQTAKARGIDAEIVRKTFGEGRTLLAPEALAAKMIDRIATFDQTVARLMGAGGKRGAAAEDGGLELQADHTDTGRDTDGKFHAQCDCDDACPCMQDGPDLCPDNCLTCQPTCSCLQMAPKAVEAPVDQAALDEAALIAAGIL